MRLEDMMLKTAFPRLFALAINQGGKLCEHENGQTIGGKGRLNLDDNCWSGNLSNVLVYEAT